MNWKASARAVGGVAYKEFLHIYRDKRIVALVLLLPPLFTLLFGHAFQATALKGVPALLEDQDRSSQSEKLAVSLEGKEAFAWRTSSSMQVPDLLHAGVQAVLVIPAGWGKSLQSAEPIPIRLVLDGSDTDTAAELEGTTRETLGEFQSSVREDIIENLPDEVIEMGKKLPVDVRHQFVSMMSPWEVKSAILYNPKLSFIEYVIPGIIGLILQLLTVTLMACTITREREAGTLYQLLVTSLRRTEIVLGKVLPYLFLSMFLIAATVAVAYFHFGVKFHQPVLLGLVCFLFLLCSLGLGLLISSFSNTQTQAIQFAVFFLLPVFPLSGAFAPIQRLPASVQAISYFFPLTHFCHAFRLVNLNHAGLSFIVGDLVFLLIGGLVTCGGAAFLLSRAQD